MKVKKYNFPTAQYYMQEQVKRIIVLHHTVSGVGVDGDVKWWEQTPEKVATPIIIDREGTVHEIFEPKYWAHHLGIKSWMLSQMESTVSNDRLNQISIGIELDSWGGLVEKNGKFYNFAGSEVPISNVIKYPKGYRGYYAYEKYTEAQISALKEVLISLHTDFKISLKYNTDMWDFNSRALKGSWGLWTHTSFRPDKSDCHPQPELINMLKSLQP